MLWGERRCRACVCYWGRCPPEASVHIDQDERIGGSRRCRGHSGIWAPLRQGPQRPTIQSEPGTTASQAVPLVFYDFASQMNHKNTPIRRCSQQSLGNKILVNFEAGPEFLLERFRFLFVPLAHAILSSFQPHPIGESCPDEHLHRPRDCWLHPFDNLQAQDSQL